MKVMGLDASKSVTGWGVTDAEEWWSGALRCPIKKPFHVPKGSIDAGYASAVADWLDRELYALIGTHKPDSVAIEQPMPGNIQRQKTIVDTSTDWAGKAIRKETVGNTAFDVTHFLHGVVWVALRICKRLDIPCIYVPSQTWRPKVGITRPPSGVPTDKRSQWYKAEAKKLCEHRGIKVRSADEAEAVCIAIYEMDRHEPGFALGKRSLFARAS